MKRLAIVITSLLILLPTQALASPLINHWAGTGLDADKYFCEYGDGEIKVIYGNQNCPLSN